MTPKQKALYALMEDHGYSHACITATIMLLRNDRYALDEMIVFIEDEKPSEVDIIEKTAELLQKQQDEELFVFPSISVNKCLQNLAKWLKLSIFAYIINALNLIIYDGYYHYNRGVLRCR